MTAYQTFLKDLSQELKFSEQEKKKHNYAKFIVTGNKIRTLNSVFSSELKTKHPNRLLKESLNLTLKTV